MVNVIIVFPKIEEAKSIKNLLIRNGISVTKVCTTGAQAAQAADACDDGVIICGYKFLDMMYSDLENYIPKYFDMIVLSSKKNYEEVRDSGVVCLSMPIKSMDFVNTVSLTIENLLWERKRESPGQRREPRKRRRSSRRQNSSLCMTLSMMNRALTDICKRRAWITV